LEVPNWIPKLEGLRGDPAFESQASAAVLEALRRSPDAENSRWHERLAVVSLAAGRPSDAHEHVQLSIELATKAGQDLELRRAFRTAALIYISQDEIDRASYYVASLDGLGYARAPESFGLHAKSRGWLALRSGSLESGLFYEAESRFRSFLRVSEELGDVPSQVRAYLGISSALGAVGTYPLSIEQADLGLKLTLGRNSFRNVPILLLSRALAIRDMGVHDQAEIGLMLAIEWAEAIGNIATLARAWMGLGVIQGYAVSTYDLSNLEASEMSFARAEKYAVQAEAPQIQNEIYDWLMSLYTELGMTVQADKYSLKRVRRPTVNSNSKPSYYGQNSTDTRKLVEERRISRFTGKLRDAIEISPDAKFIFDVIRNNGTDAIEFVNEFRNRKGDDFLASDSGQVWTLRKLSEKPAFSGLIEVALNTVAERTIYEDEIRISTCPDLWISRRVVPVGEGIGLAIRDVTLSHAASAALFEAAERARQADRAKSEFLANMSHEVRTPINGVLGLAHLLSETDLDRTQRKYVDGIRASADILLNVIGDVLDLSKIEAGRIEVKPVAANLEHVVQKTLSLFRGQAKNRSIGMAYHLSASLPDHVFLDEKLLGQILANLIGNAVKFTTEGSVTILVRQSEANLRFEVTDTGPGIPEHELEEIFQAFAQGTMHEFVHGGTGLGLTISRRLTTLMGGSMGVMSKVGQGTTFWFELPLVVANSVAKVESPGLPSTLIGAKVLLVEDNPVNVMVASVTLRNSGCEVALAANGKIGVEMAISGKYDCILMDVRMPVMDGLEATRQIREIEKTTGHHVPIIALTASALTDDRNECFEAGMDDYLGKPFNLDSLKNTLSRWLYSN
jgi:signal transduction histidine kinase